MYIFCFILFSLLSPISCLCCAHYTVRPDEKDLHKIKSPTVSVECVSDDYYCVNMLIPTQNTTLIPSQWLGCSFNVSDAITENSTYHLEPNCSIIHNSTNTSCMLAHFLDDNGKSPYGLTERPYVCCCSGSDYCNCDVYSSNHTCSKLQGFTTGTDPWKAINTTQPLWDIQKFNSPACNVIQSYHGLHETNWHMVVLCNKPADEYQSMCYDVYYFENQTQMKTCDVRKRSVPNECKRTKILNECRCKYNFCNTRIYDAYFNFSHEPLPRLTTTTRSGPPRIPVECIDTWHGRQSTFCNSDFGVCFDLYSTKWLVQRNPDKYDHDISYKGCIEDFTWVSRMSTVDQYSCVKAGNYGARTVVGDHTFVHCCFVNECNKKDIAKEYKKKFMKHIKKRLESTEAGQKVTVIFELIVLSVLLILFVL